MKKSIIVFGAFIGLLATSCGKMLEVTPPNAIYDEQIQGLLAEGGEKAEQVINAFASPLASYFDLNNIAIGSGSANVSTNTIQGINLMNTIQGNDVAYGCSATTTQEAYTGVTLYRLKSNLRLSIAPANGAHWYGYAYGMNQSNLLLGYTKNLDKTSNLYYSSEAQGRTVRAFCYMSLMEEYAPAYCNMVDPTAENSGMSLYKAYKPAQNASSPAARSTAKETYEFIVADLDTAITFFKKAGVGFTHEDAELEDIDLGVANFLKARAGLFIGDKKISTISGEKSGWQICKEACDEIIAGGYDFIKPENWGNRIDVAEPTDSIKCYPENNAFVCVRKAINPETILGYIIGSTKTAGATQNGILNIYGSYPGGNYLMGRIDERLYAKIDANDCRKAAFVASPIKDLKYGDGKTVDMPSYCNVKFASRYGLAADGISHTAVDKIGNVEFCKFRYSEVVLMSAEAELALNGAAAATTVLNKLLAARTVNGQPALTVANYGGQDWSSKVKDLIKLQWSIEMWGECGREYFNNKRLKIDINRTGSSVHADAKGTDGDWYKWQNMTLDFPENEVLYNANYKADAVNTPEALK